MESTRAHILAVMGNLVGLAARLTARPLSSGLAMARLMLDNRAMLARELAWADERAAIAEGAEVDVLTGYRLYVVRALVLAEGSLATYPDVDPDAAGAAANALGEIVTLRGDVEGLTD